MSDDVIKYSKYEYNNDNLVQIAMLKTDGYYWKTFGSSVKTSIATHYIVINIDSDIDDVRISVYKDAVISGLRDEKIKGILDEGL
jgi:hypothetical protein